MTSTLLLTLLALLTYSLILIAAPVQTAGTPAHPAEGYPFGDPASPTRAEREAMLRAPEAQAAAA